MGKAGSPRSAASSALMLRIGREKPTAGQGRPRRSQGEASRHAFRLPASHTLLFLTPPGCQTEGQADPDGGVAAGV